MIKNRFLLFLVLFQFAYVPVFAQVSIVRDSTLHIYILMGQSNMAGRGVITPEFQKIENPKVLVWQKDGTWGVAKHPLHYDKPSVAGVGPGLSFGIEMENANPYGKIGLIPCAVGGTSIEKWTPGAYDVATKTHPFDDAVQRIQMAMQYGVIKGIIWHQGESNSSPDRYVDYLPKLNTLILEIRKLVGKQVPVVIGELGRYKDVYAGFNSQIAKAPEFISNSVTVSSVGLKDKGDQTHFDSASAEEYGRRFAKAMLKIQANPHPVKSIK
ncbi:sialate O-acetylesterase [Pedobacter sp. Leaf194]|uniref:sialate O-acetylesterase n=1 Tax=Pedobacter sp. Leaf194 TaxID=1736297 RepID=UPI000702C3BB|nr:sialate O-acetylesterase [Pedobacter sp. Leaf194]KQS36777.1 hypothetical protein ASG14_06985 [Pedobacter sp. Leaf194]